MTSSGVNRRIFPFLTAAVFLVGVGCGQRGGTNPPSSPSAPFFSFRTPSPGSGSAGLPSPICGAYGCVQPPGQSAGASSGAPAGQAGGVTTIGTQSASGDQAVAYAYGTADHPAQIIAKIEAKPNQGINGGWSIVCSRGSEEKSGFDSFAGQTPAEVPIPLPLQNPDTCTASAVAALTGSGTLTVTLLAY
jgi:hypothetical protein